MSNFFSLHPIDSNHRSLQLIHDFMPMSHAQTHQLVSTLPKCQKGLKSKKRLFESEYNLKAREDSSEQGSSSRNCKNAQIRQPKPKHKFCQVCKQPFEDYLLHIYHPVHRNRVQEADAECDWQYLAERARNEQDKENKPHKRNRNRQHSICLQSQKEVLPKRQSISINSFKSIPSSQPSKKRIIFQNGVEIVTVQPSFKSFNENEFELELQHMEYKPQKSNSSNLQQEEKQSQDVVIISVRSTNQIGCHQRKAGKRFSQFRNLQVSQQMQYC